MGDYNLMICRTCKQIEVIDDIALIAYIEVHMGHTFTVLPDSILEDIEEVGDWLREFMGWPKEAET